MSGAVRWAGIAVALCAAVLGYALVREVLWARTFPLVHDAAILHYVTFMIGRGHAPYLQQVEMNLPGVLMTEWATMHGFGADAAGLWRWDTFVGACAVAACAGLAGRGWRLAGACGAALAWLLHLNDGAYDLGEREWLLAVLMVLCAWCAVQCLERRQPVWMAGCLALGGWGAAIKPYAVLWPAVVLATVLAATLRPGMWALPPLPAAGRRRIAAQVMLWSSIGSLLPIAATALYFGHWPGSFAAFIQTERTLGAWYAQGSPATLRYMLLRVMLYPTLLVLGLTAYLALRERFRLALRASFLAAGAIVGAVLYLAQRKGFPYHVYPLLLFVLSLGFLLAQRALASAPWDRRVIAVALLLVGGVRLPLKVWREHAKAPYPVETQQALIADLQRLGGQSLDGHVQCLDMTLGGCIGALYDLRLQQPTGFVNDNMLFPQRPAPVTKALQTRFLQEMSARPPRLVVLSAHNFPNQDDFTFSKLRRWPAFAAWLARHYRLVEQHTATTVPHSADYRIYELN